MFVSGHDFSAPAEKQFLWLSQALVDQGHLVAISIGKDLSSAAREGADSAPGLTLMAHRFRGPRLRRSDLAAARRFAPDVIHAITPRSPMISAARQFSSVTGAPVVVHFSDHDWGLSTLRGTDNLPPLRRATRLVRRVLGTVQPPLWEMATRSSIRWTLRHAAAYDALTPTLARYVEERTGRSCAVSLPVTPPPSEPAEAPPLPEQIARKPLVLFAGAFYDAQEHDVLLGMRAVAAVRQRGHDVAYVHAGAVAPRFDAPALARARGLQDGSFAFVGNLPFASAFALMQRATVLIQPGRPDEVNRLRLPSKLQGYLPSGTPTITFAVGFGELLEDGIEVLKTHTDSPGELADRICAVLEDPALAARLAEGGRVAARRLFDPGRNAARLVEFYATVTGDDAPSRTAPAVSSLLRQS
jgi:glycosyltransferase involved in cell wall biosynthesis